MTGRPLRVPSGSSVCDNGVHGDSVSGRGVQGVGPCRALVPEALPVSAARQCERGEYQGGGGEEAGATGSGGHEGTCLPWAVGWGIPA
ncbi:hypothetical protein GCM10022403_062380 [Streptomyces coacervatus]|uniref:Uncharacterized protein n=1 Tax=Streptomyces coacervatus TaxID=647381 RepID=A0ABP7IK32_9ACTN